ncbi:protoporphyrinogen oxidase [Paenibacillus lemnae]|uniref:Coproporphyrinogen III oxidase n=1 Tax=Paenibacillus lemnae TaxID=1330551 RepID=A0A848MAT0_PAELE|nr:protoporphyrinogen oxidase [Paenibacillus lemnae]NMO98197.1 protoporphyrinogen oxidase [Paenibacillus lemnae]
MTTTVVIGGGITGLSALYYLHKESSEMELFLIEADPVLGGKIRTSKHGEFIMETGADSIVARKGNVFPLIEEIGLKDEVVYNGTGTSYIYTDHGLKKIPADSVFGIPAGIQSLVESELVSDQGKLEALKDLYAPNESFTKSDSLGLFLKAFLGEELVQKQIAPVISGVYSGELDDLTISSTLPFLLDYKNEYGSIILGLHENRHKYLGAAGKKFISFKEGMSSFIDKMEEKAERARIYKGVQAERIERAGERYNVYLGNGETLQADHIVLSSNSGQAKALLNDEELTPYFKRLYTKSMISVYLAFDVPDASLPSDGTGFINSGGEGLICDACTWSSRKWEHTSKERQLLVRLFYKSSNPSYEALSEMTDDDLKHTAVQDIAASLNIHAAPVEAIVTKWLNNMPNYHLEHRQIVDTLERKLEKSWPGVQLAGCSYYGVGIPDCIMKGKEAADNILSRVGAK